MSDTTISLAAPAATPKGGTASPGRRAPAADAPGFTALLSAALGGHAPTAEATLLLSTALAGDGEAEDAAIAADPDASATDPAADADAAAAVDDAVTALVAAAVAGTAPAASGRPGAATDGTDAGDAPLPAPAPTDPAVGDGPVTAAAASDDVAERATAIPASGGAAGTASVVTAAPAAPAGAAGDAAATLAAVDGEPVAPMPPATESAAAAAEPSATRADAGVTPVSGATASVTASAESAPAAAPAETGTVHARMVARVMDALDVLENAPPPRRMTVELPDADGLRLHVALRGAEVHVSILGGGTAGDHSGWSRDLTTALAARGFQLGGFDSGDRRGERRQPADELPQPDGPPTRARRARPAVADQGLRL